MITDQDIEDVLRKTPRAVSVLGGVELRRVLAAGEREVRRRYAAAEWLVRGWLERKPLETLRHELASVNDLAPEPLLAAFEHIARPLRDAWPRQRHPMDTPAVRQALDGVWVEAWKFLCTRIAEFCMCDGIFPVVVPDGAVVVPFRLRRNFEKRDFVDMDGTQVPGWNKEVLSVWESLGFRFKVTLGCWFGFATTDGANRIVSGNSFGLALLLASSREPRDFDPLAILCTGGVLQGRLQGVDGLIEKEALAKNLGVKLFAWVGATGAAPPVARDGIFELGDQISLHAGLSGLWDELTRSGLVRISMTEISHRIRRSVKELPQETATAELDKARELAANVFGRNTQITWLAEKAREQLAYEQPRWLWIEGESGGGKTTFAAGFALRLARQGLSVFTHFFSDEQSLDIACARAADFLVHIAPIDFSGLAKEDGFTRLSHAFDELSNSPPASPVALIFDGTDEADDNIARMGMLKQVRNVLLVFSSTPVRSGTAIAELRSNRPMIEMGHRNQQGCWEAGLGRLARGFVHQWLASISPPIPPDLREAIVLASQGLPQLVAAFISDFQAGALTDLPTGTTLPSSLDAYYARRIDELLSGQRVGDFNNALLHYVLAQLATAHGRWAVDEDALAYLLAPILAMLPGVELTVALARGGGLLEYLPGRGWRLFHGSLQTHLQNLPLDRRHVVDDARTRWVALREKWKDTALPRSLRLYIARNLPASLAEANDKAGLLALATDSEFRKFQEQTFPDVPRAGTDTIHLALKTSLAAGDFCSAAEMAFLHSPHIERLAQTNLLQLVQLGHYSRAVALADLAENWDTRLLCKLAIAAALMVNGLPREAAALLDDLASQRHAKLWTKFEPGTGACAAVLLPLLVGVPTRHFDWFGLKDAFRGDEKLDMAFLMGARGHFIEAMELVETEERNQKREDARRKILKQLAAIDSRQAMLWLEEFTLPEPRAWASLDLVEAFTERGLLTGNNFWHKEALRAEEQLWRRPEADDVFAVSRVHSVLWQRMKCKVARAVGQLARGNLHDAQTLLDASKRLLDETPSQPFFHHDWRFAQTVKKANAYAALSKTKALVSYGCGRALSGDTAAATIAFQRAFNSQRQRQDNVELRTEPDVELRSENAGLLITFITELAQALPCEPAPKWFRTALDRFEEVINGCDRGNQIEQRFELGQQLASLGRIEDAEAQLGKLRELKHPGKLAELLPHIAAQAARVGLDMSNYRARFNKPDDQLLIAGRIAKDRSLRGETRAAVEGILAEIRLRPAILVARSWGPACVGGAIGSVGMQNGASEFATTVFRECEQRVANTPISARPRFLAELAEFYYSGGCIADGMRVMGQAADLVRGAYFPNWKVAAHVLSTKALWEDSADVDFCRLIGDKFDPTRHFESARSAAEIIPIVAKLGFTRLVSDLLSYANRHLEATPHEIGRWNAHAAVSLALAQAAIARGELTQLAETWHDYLDKEIERRSAPKGHRERLFRPQNLKHAQALIKAIRGDFPSALRIVRGIRVAEPRSDALRDLALFASGDPALRHNVRALMFSISNRPDTHLPRIVSAFAQAGAKDDALALFPACADYFDATCRAVAVLVQLIKPDETQLRRIWCACLAAVEAE